MYTALVACFSAALFANQAVAGYALQDDYNSGNWLSMFDFFTASDPTHGMWRM